MAEDAEYELLPKEEVENLKKEIERLKKNPLGTLPEGENLLDAINNLNTNINKLIDIFTKAEADLVKEYADSNPADDIRAIKEQNEQIAEGLVSVADMIKDVKEEKQPISPGPKMPMPGPSVSAPAPDFFPGAQPRPMPGPQAQPLPSLGPAPPEASPFGLPPGPVPELPPLNEPLPNKKKGLFSRK